MDRNAVLFALIRSVICKETLSENCIAACTAEMLESVYALADKHDLAHLVGQAVSKLGLADSEALTKCKNAAMQAFMRYMRQDYEYQNTCKTLEAAKIPFLPLKGSVLRAYYPEGWMRTSCDADILVRPEDLQAAINALTAQLSYTPGERATHDVVLYCPGGEHIELHFDLVEEGRANAASAVLRSVWETATLSSGWEYRYEMTDELFYFYHIAHMAKHVQTGGCGIRPFVDLWILDRLEHTPQSREELLEKGGLLGFANVARKLSRVWMEGEAEDAAPLNFQQFLFTGGVYGSSENRVALRQGNSGGWLRYFLSRLFVPHEKLKGYYPILEKYPWLMPVMQVRRWFMLLDPSVAKMAKSEWIVSSSLDGDRADGMKILMDQLCLENEVW